MSKKTPSFNVTTAANTGVDHCLALLKAGRLDQFELAARQLAARHPKGAKPLQLVGLAALMSGKLQEAVDALQASARLDQHDASTWGYLGIALQRAGHYQAAAEAYQGSVSLDPTVAAVWVNAASNFAAMGDYVLARNLSFQATRLAPDLPEAWANLGNALRLLGDSQDAVRALLKAVHLDPRCAPAHMGLARIMGDASAQRLELALKHARLAIEADPEGLDNRLTLAQLCGFPEEVADLCRAIVAHHPLDSFVTGALLFSLLSDPRSAPQEHLQVARRFNDAARQAMQPPACDYPNPRDPDRPLRVGFLSGDFCNHAMAPQLAPLWRALDRSRIEVHAWYTRAHRDAWTDTLQAMTDGWIDATQLSDEQLAASIRDSRIDILIDLSGYTDFNRLGALLRHPAPLTMHWLGYMATLGLDCIDYYIADPVLAPPGAEAAFTEKLIRLPLYTNQQGLTERPPGPLPALGSGYVTFGSLARKDKINAKVLDLWSEVLRQLPAARMLLVIDHIDEVRRRLLEGFAARGVAAGRIDFVPRQGGQAYVDLFDRIDIQLDTFPFSGGTTTSDALWMGVPTVTLMGEATQQRLAAARLAAVGLNDWVAASPAEYVRMVCSHARNLAGLAELRQGLRQRVQDAPLRQEAAFAAAFEQGLRQAWQRWCAGEPPAHIDVAPRPATGARFSRARKPRTKTTTTD